MSEIIDGGIADIEEQLKAYAANASGDAVLNVLKAGADAFVDDLLKLPKPRSNINIEGYTHLLDSFADRASKQDSGVLVGWGKYYGPIVEKKQPHLHPLWDTNKDKYYEIMQRKLTEV